MSPKALGMLAGIAGLMLVVGVISVQQTQPTAVISGDRTPVFPDLKPTMADVRGVKIEKAAGKVVLDAKLSGEEWTASNKGGYPVDVEKLRALLLTLAEARYLEQKTANPDQYHHLGVRNLIHTESVASQITIEREGKEPLSILVGKPASGWDGSYARLPDVPQSWVLDRKVTIAEESIDWLQRQVIDIGLERVRSVEHLAPGGERLRVSKSSPTQALFDVEGIPEGHQLSYESVPEVVADVIDNLRLEDVQPLEGFVWSEDKMHRQEFQTFDGLVIESRAQEINKEQYVAFSVRYDPQARYQPETATAASGPADAATTAQTSDTPEQTPNGETPPQSVDEDAVMEDDVASISASESATADGLKAEEEARSEAQSLQARISKWVFRIPEYRYRGFTKKLAEMVKPVESETAEDAVDPADSVSLGDPAGHG